MDRSRITDENNRDGAKRRLLVSGVLTFDDLQGTWATVERGMSILSPEGHCVGKVAAVSVGEDEVVEAILLSRLPLKMAYRIVSADTIVVVSDQDVVLDLTADGIEGLEKWDPIRHYPAPVPFPGRGARCPTGRPG